MYDIDNLLIKQFNHMDRLRELQNDKYTNMEELMQIDSEIAKIEKEIKEIEYKIMWEEKSQQGIVYSGIHTIFPEDNFFI